MIAFLMKKSSSSDLAFAIVFRSDTVCTLPDQRRAEQSYHTNDGKNDG